MGMTQFKTDKTQACEKSRALLVVNEADGVIVIRDDAGYAEAGPVLALLRDLVKRGRELFADTIQKSDQAHTAAIVARNEAIKEPDEAEKKLNQAMKDFIVVRNRAQAVKDKAAEDARLAAAVKVEEAGDPELANAMLDTPLPKAAAAPKAAGLAAPRDNWKARVTNFQALVESVAAGAVKLDALQASETWLNTQARDFRCEGPMCAGVECYNDPVIPRARR